MNKLEQAARQALEALIKANHFHDYEDEITALREALAQPQDMKECRHCGWLCKPNDTPSRKGYVLAQPQGCPHRIADARNPIVKSGYICVDCGALFSAADHEAPPIVPQGEPVACECGGWEFCSACKGTGLTGYYTIPPSVEAAVLAERERLCSAIKAEDDYCVDNGDYMLDSDDCIAIVRGTWKRPDYAIGDKDAAIRGMK